MNYILVFNYEVSLLNNTQIQEFVKLNTGFVNMEIFNPVIDKGKKNRTYSLTLTKEIINKTNKNLFDISKCLVLNEGESLTELSQNTLLKTLEESKYSFVILVNNLSSLLDTLQSRCLVKYVDYVGDNLEKEVEFSYPDIERFSKEDRQEVVKYLDKVYESLDTKNKVKYYDTFDEVIKRIKSNCKIDASLYHLVYKMNE